MNLFEPKDFDTDETLPESKLGWPQEYMAHRANAKFNEWLEKQPVVWKIENANAWGEDRNDWQSGKLTHKARLVAIEEIKCGKK